MNITKRLTSALLMLVLTGLSIQSHADQRGTSQEALLLLDNAIDALHQQGATTAFEQFNDPQGAFVQGDLYIFAIDMNGKYMASGANPKLVGQTLADTKDATGKPIGQEILKLADRIGYGIIEYQWLNRENNNVEHKFSRIKKVDNYVLGVGFYLPDNQ